jgi:hypothetical protein
MNEMSRGEMIRRLDQASKEVHDHLANGPLTPDDCHTMAASLERLLPAVADRLQEQEDRDPRRLQRHAHTQTHDKGTAS